MVDRKSGDSIHRVTSQGLGTQHHLAFAAALLLGLPGTVGAQALDANLWVTDGNVHAIAPWGSTIYVGGKFTYVGPNTGGMVELDEHGRATKRLPRVDGEVRAVVDDGAGGWFIGGSFTHVAGIARAGLARILSDGSVSVWSPNPAPAGIVTCLLHHGSRLFVATDAPSTPVILRAFDDVTGDQVSGWAPELYGAVYTLAADGTTLFVGGNLSFINSDPFFVGIGIAAIDTDTGTIENWNAAPDGAEKVTGLLVDGQWLYVTGDFSSIGGQSHGRLARALLATKSFDPTWNPTVDGAVKAMAMIAGNLCIGGAFGQVNGQHRDRIAVLNDATGLPTSLAPNLASVTGVVCAIVPDPAPAPSYAYLGLMQDEFFSEGPAQRMVIRVSLSQKAIDEKWSSLGIGTPPDGVREISGLRFSGTRLLASGSFISLGGRRQVGVAAFDRLSGIPRKWDPGLTSTLSLFEPPSVAAIVPTPHAIYVAGRFTHAGGQARYSVAAFDSADGRVQPWRADLTMDPTTIGYASALALFGDRLLVGGVFNSVSGEPHLSLAQVDTSSGTPVTGWTADVYGEVRCLLVRSGTLFVGGDFSFIGGEARSRIAALNASSGAVLGWNLGTVEGAINALASRSDTLYIAGGFTSVGGEERNSVAAATISSGTLLSWDPRVLGGVQALAIDGPHLVVGGGVYFAVDQFVSFLARLDRGDGSLVGGSPVTNGVVLALTLDGGSLHVGGSFGQMAQSPTAYLARVGGADGAGPGVQVVAANGGEYLVVGTTYRHEYTASDPSGVASVDVELSRTGAGGPFTLLAAGLRNTGHYEWAVTGPNVASNAFLRVTARDFAGNLANDASNLAFTIGVPTTDVQPGHDAALGTLVLGPNPARIRTDLRFTLAQPTRVMLRLLDVQGREVWAAPERAFEAGEHALPLELEGIRPGLYFLRHDLGRGSQTTRLVVIR